MMRYNLGVLPAIYQKPDFDLNFEYIEIQELIEIQENLLQNIHKTNSQLLIRSITRLSGSFQSLKIIQIEKSLGI